MVEFDVRANFDDNAVQWMNSMFKQSNSKSGVPALLGRLRVSKESHPDRLRERIAEVQALLREEAERQEQEQNSGIQRKNVELQE
jgi:hypothetical protein